MNLNDIARHFSDEDRARAFLEAQRWPNGPICPHCATEGESYRLEPKAEGKTHVRPGVWKCGTCRKQYTVRVGTIFEDSHIPLHKWLMAIHLLCSSKKGMSAHQLHRMLGLTYKTAWFMAHRIRYAMSQEPLSSKLKGTVEVDETYVGGKGSFRGRAKQQAMVVGPVERGGNVRSFHKEVVSAKTLNQIIRENVHPESHIMTDEFAPYRGLRREFGGHSTIRHKWHVYARREGDVLISTNTNEGYFSIVKRGINGVYHHVGKQHLHRYLSEFDFRYNGRHVNDGQRCLPAIKGADGKRLMLRDSSAAAPKNN